MTLGRSSIRTLPVHLPMPVNWSNRSAFAFLVAAVDRLHRFAVALAHVQTCRHVTYMGDDMSEVAEEGVGTRLVVPAAEGDVELVDRLREVDEYPGVLPGLCKEDRIEIR